MKKLALVLLLSVILLILLAVISSIVVGSVFSDVPLLAFPFSNAVAVIPIKGEITSEGDSLSGSLSAGQIVEKIEEAENDPMVGAILFDIDSGGGSVVATKQIVYKIRGLSKPSVSYIGEVGASGAYYIAAATDYIVSDADSITGSIGVISIVPNIEELLKKAGIEVKVIKAGKLKAMGSPFSPMAPEEEKIITDIIQQAFDGFRADVLSFREGKLSKESFENIADGRILSGRQALKENLVDSLGSMQDAVDKAAELANISGKPVLKYYSKEELGFFDIFSSAGYNFGRGFLKAFSPENSSATPEIKAQ